MLLRPARSIIIAKKKPPTLTYIGSASPTHSNAVATYSSANVGSAAGFTNRRIICVLSSNAQFALISTSTLPTIGGNPATIHVQNLIGSGSPGTAIFSAGLATGSSTTIVITYASNIFNDVPLDIYAVDDAFLSSSTPNVGSNTNSGSVTSLSSSAYNQSNQGFTVAALGIGVGTTGVSIAGFTVDRSTAGAIETGHQTVSGTSSVTANASWTTAGSAAISVASWR
jgi:hypothetical protein